jgi:signal peptidase I
MRVQRLAVHVRRWIRASAQEAIDTVRFLGGVAALWFAMTSLAFATFYIPSESMQPTLEVGDRILVSKWAYGYSRHSLPLGFGDALPWRWNGRIGWSAPRRGEVVVLREERQGINLIKRVVGIGGDEIAVDAGRLYINGQQVSREWIERRRYREEGRRAHGSLGREVDVDVYLETLPGGIEHVIYERSDAARLDDFGPVTVPEGHVFLMGDNRDNSVDSRDARGPGYVALSAIIGRAETVPFTLERCHAEVGLHCPSGRVWRGL